MTQYLRADYERIEQRVTAAIASGDPARFDELALEVHRYQRSANPAYDQYCSALALAPAETWRDIPAVPQAAFKLTPLRSFPQEAEIAAFRTSGTTGEGYGTHHFCSMRLYEEAVLRGWDLLRLPIFSQLMLIAAPLDAPHSSLSHMMGILKARADGGEQHWCVSAKGGLDIAQIESLIADSKGPVMILATALALLHWIEKGSAVQLPRGSMIFETGGYKGSGRDLSKEELYAMLGDHCGIEPENILNEYGMTELSSQCYSRGLGHPHVAPPWVRAVVIHPASGLEVADGETGVLRIYDLANLGSVIGIQTRDFAIRRGSDFELLGRDPAALPRGCSRAADEMLSAR